MAKTKKPTVEDENRVLRKENDELRRTIARLRKSLEKHGEPKVEDDDDLPEPPKATGGDVGGHPCPAGCKGGGGTRVISTPTSDVVVCTSCKARRKL